MSATLGPLRFNCDADAEAFRDWALAHHKVDVRDLEDWEVQQLHVDMTETCYLSCEGYPRFDDDAGIECPACAAVQAREAAYWRREWETASPAERDPMGYRRDMIDGGRGHLLRDDER